MRFVKIENNPIVYAYDKADMMERTGSPEDLINEIYDTFNRHFQGYQLKLYEVNVKDCKNCDNWIDGRCDYFVDPTDEDDDRFCTGFKWRRY